MDQQKILIFLRNYLHITSLLYSYEIKIKQNKQEEF